MAMAVLFEGTVTGVRSVRISGQYEEALSRAQSHLAALERPGGLVAGSQAGVDGDGFRWRTRVSRLAVAPPPDGLPASARPALYAVGVAITWEMDGGSREVRLDTQRLGAVAAEPP